MPLVYAHLKPLSQRRLPHLQAVIDRRQWEDGRSTFVGVTRRGGTRGVEAGRGGVGDQFEDNTVPVQRSRKAKN